MHKPQAIRKVNQHLGSPILNVKNTHFANNKKKAVWWLNIPQQKFEDDLHILLVKDDAGGLIWLKIDANAIREPNRAFRIRGDNGSVDLGICRQPLDKNYLKDKYFYGGYDFSPHIQFEWD